MKMRLIIKELAPSAQCGGPGPRDELEWSEWWWEDQRPKPTWKQVKATWAVIEPTLPDPEHERLIAAKAAELQRAEAIDTLKASGDLPPDYKEPVSG